MSKDVIAIVGNVTEIFPERKISEKFSVREFKIVTDDDYPQTLQMTAKMKNIGQLDKVNVGDKISVKINIAGRDAGSPPRNYISLEAWSISVISKATGKSGDVKPAAKAQVKEADDDLPF